ncbi:MAG: transglutaminase-like domain-containing protein [Eubacteriales bacterium]|nr:transglutaminase-like domain-containing protein [Eubacteriales bacterium]
MKATFRKTLKAAGAAVTAFALAAGFTGASAKAASKPTFTNYKDARSYVYENVMAMDKSIDYTLVLGSISGLKSFSNNSVSSLSNLDDGHTVKGDFAEHNNYKGDSFSYTYIHKKGKYYVTVKDKVSYRLSSSQNKAYKKKLKKTLKSLKLKGSNTAKVKKIYKYITKNVKYDNNYKKSGSTTYTAYGALNKKKAVCNGYATLFYDMCREAGIPSRVIVGKTSGGLHAWNIVKLDGKWYNCDATWDAGSKKFHYFLKCNKDFKDHKRDAKYATKSFSKSYPMASKSK